MKTPLLFVALLPLLLVGCASSDYVSDYPTYYGPGYYYDRGYYGPPPVTVSYYSGGSYHGYHHYANNYHRSYASAPSHTTTATRVSSNTVTRSSGGSHTTTATRTAHVRSSRVNN